MKKWFDYMASFPGVTLSPHFEKDSFRVNKKIWATWDDKNQRLCVKLKAEEQDVFCSMSGEKVYAVPNAWGKQGWTFVEPLSLDKHFLTDILHESFKTVASPKLWNQIPVPPF
jgi:predicted DNA-binding protein (MmcQ/YjbR family)